MRKLLAFLLISAIVLQTSACSAPTKVIHGVEYSDYGLLNEDNKNPDVQYEPNWWNIFVAVIFSETIIVPIYVAGYHLFEPVGPKPSIPGQVSGPGADTQK